MTQKKAPSDNEQDSNRRLLKHDVTLLLDASVDGDTILALLSNKYHIARTAVSQILTEEQDRRQASGPRRVINGDSDPSLPSHFNEKDSAATRQFVKALNLFNDDYCRIVLADNREGVAEIVRPVLDDPDAEVRDVQIQKVTPGWLKERSICIDVRVALNDRRIAAIEVQRDQNGIPPERVRFIEAREDTARLAKGDDFRKLYELFTIILCEVDPYKSGLPMYHIDKTVRELDRPYEDGRHIIYVNGMYKGDDEIGRLIHDLRATQPADMYNPALRAAAERIKDNILGGNGMIDLADASPQFVELMHTLVQRAFGAELQQKDKEIQQKDSEIQQKDSEIQQIDKRLQQEMNLRRQAERELQDMASEMARLRALHSEQDPG